MVYGHPSILSIPIPKTQVIWVSPYHITLAIWVRVRVGVTGGCPYITTCRVWEWGCPIHITVTAGKGRGTGKRGKRRDLAMKIMVDKGLGDETNASEQKGVMQWTGVKFMDYRSRGEV